MTTEATTELCISITEANADALKKALAAGQKSVSHDNRVEVRELSAFIRDAESALKAVELDGVVGAVYVTYGVERPEPSRSHGYSYKSSTSTGEIRLELAASGEWELIGVQRASRTSSGIGERVIHPVTGEELHLKTLARELERDIRRATKAKAPVEEVDALKARLHLIPAF